MRQEKFDIVFLDHMMPNMDGIETLKVLKDEDLLGGAVVIALTANAVVGAEAQYLSAGFDGYLSKPITVNDIEKTLKKYLPAGVIENGASEAPGVKSSKLSLDKLRALGLNVDAALVYTCNDEDFYMELLTDYAESAADKCHDLSAYLENGDIKNYEILVHSLKSASKTVGADGVSEQARALEEASRNKDMSFVNEHHGAFVESFTSLAEKILG
jgi:PleD family two-component response regulator